MKSATRNYLSICSVALIAIAAMAATAGDAVEYERTSDRDGHAAARRSHAWHDIVIEKDADLRLRDALADGAGGLWVLFSRRAKGRALDQGDLHLMQVDPDGRRGDSVAVVLPAALDSRQSGATVALALGADGRPAVLRTTATGIALIEPAVAADQVSRTRHLATEGWLYSARSAGAGRFRVVTSEAILLWSDENEPQVELAAGKDQAFVAASPAAGGFAVLLARVTGSGFDTIRAGRSAASDPAAAVFRRLDEGGRMALLWTRLTASPFFLSVLAPVEKGPPSLWQRTVFDRDMNLVHSGRVTLPFEVTYLTPLATYPQHDGSEFLASFYDGRLWLARMDADGNLHERAPPSHLLPPGGQRRLMIDMQWVASSETSSAILASTVVVFDPGRERPDYGLWFARVALTD